MSYSSFAEIEAEARSLGRVRLSVAAAHDACVLQAVKVSVDKGLVEPVLVGDGRKIEKLADQVGLSLEGVEIINTSSDEQAASEAVKVVSAGRAEVLLKGMVNSSDFMRAVLSRDYGLKNGRLLSHLAVMQIPGYERLLFITDGGINVQPNLVQKKEILQNAVNFMRDLGWKEPKAAVLTANEKMAVNMPTTLDAALLVKMAQDGEIQHAVVEGPMALDIAVSSQASHHKGINTVVAGHADLLLVPTIEVGNALAKALVFFAGATMAGVVLGTAVPIILTSRVSSPEEKHYSIAMSCLAKQKPRNQLSRAATS